MATENKKKTWTKKLATTVSNFFQGFNIFSRMENSKFGMVQNTIETLFSKEDLSEYVLPKVIVIGNESTGKSSLLENITKCQIFPRDNKICTKCPIKVRLTNSAKCAYSIEYKDSKITINNKEEIYKIICDIMSKIPDDAIQSDKITINITEDKLPTFEFYDLPGIRAYPPEMAKQTTDLCNKYLSDENAIILCVVPATTPRLTSCQSIALISEKKMEKNTILALTMCDRIQEENIEELLIKRIIETSDEVKNLNFAGYVGVVNRNHLDTVKLEDNDDHEKQWFYENIIDVIPEEYESYRDIILGNITISNLIIKMDELYNKYIQTDWKPKILQKIENKIKLLNESYYNLGIDPIDIELYFQEICNKINENICNAIKKIETNNDFIQFKKEDRYITTRFNSDQIILDYDEIYQDLYTFLKMCINNIISSIHDINELEVKDTQNKTMKKNIIVNFKRFRSVSEKINNKLCMLMNLTDDTDDEEFVERINKIISIYESIKLKEYMTMLENENGNFKHDQRIRKLIFAEFFGKLTYPKLKPKDFVECGSFLTRRTQLQQDIETTKTHLKKIQNL